ncbi:MAG TPA: FAD-dependent oxidoreductase, partial [Gammaproteobacteria bacterium]|nr:FAD-dependent oxidoreductase [Gammaproteobacteria bacterium]
MAQPTLKLQDFDFADLFDAQGLQRLDAQFLARLQAVDPESHDRLLAYRAGDQLPGPVQLSELLLACAPVLEAFVAELFGVEPQLQTSARDTVVHDPVFVFKKQFVQRRARRLRVDKSTLESFEELDRWLDGELQRAGLVGPDRELSVARYGALLLEDTKANAPAIERLTRWCKQARETGAGRAAVSGWSSFRLPELLDYTRLVALEPVAGDPVGRMQGPPGAHRQRDGFKLTDGRMDLRAVLSEVHYCIYCHDHDGDFCSKGFPEKKGDPGRGLKENPLGVVLTGCPLEEKISEMHILKRRGRTIAALAMITIDNPMCAITGHRICNDCMKGCIYQKQDPVDIPQTETRILTDVLELPWGVEIYDLLIRWNPLRRRQWAPKPYNGRKIMVCGMGPAGITLAHHLLMEGCAVVGVDGLKIEPLPPQLLDRPIRDYAELVEELDSRVMTGFGGVAEYGITVRWDKNFLKLVYLSLARRPRLQIFGGVRFGGTVTVEEAWELGFDHLAIAVGAGLPQALPIPGSLAPGMRQANDFLMALQLTGAAKANSLTNLQLRLPAVVVGGGLTGVDTATEAQAYYIVQVEKTLRRFEVLCDAHGEAHVRGRLDGASEAILDEFLEHGRAVREERERARSEGREPDLLGLVRQWGGVTIAYRRGMEDSPAYVRNHEELSKALQEGIYYLERVNPKAARLDEHGHVEALICERRSRDDEGHWRSTGEEAVLPARSILVATGARPNTAYEFEHRGHFVRAHQFYLPHDEQDGDFKPVAEPRHCKEDQFGPFTSYQLDDKRVSYIGDTHPAFHGSVVKAIASASRTYPHIMSKLGEPGDDEPGDAGEYTRFRRRMDELLQARVQRVRRLGPSVVELVVRAPLAARRFQPGQFFRLQNYETGARRLGDTPLQTEALALSGAGVDAQAGTVRLLVQELGASSRLCATLRAGEAVSLMGPTGVRAKIPEGGETVLVAGSRRGVAHVLSTGPALRARGNRVIYIGAFPDAGEVFCQDELEAAADMIVWVTGEGAPVTVRRPQDRAVTGELADVVRRYARGELEASIPADQVDRAMFIGSPGLVRAMRDLRYGELRAAFARDPKTVGSISGPMQCMLKGVCSQCLQWQIDPATGERTKAVFACSWQDEPLEIV